MIKKNEAESEMPKEVIIELSTKLDQRPNLTNSPKELIIDGNGKLNSETLSHSFSTPITV
jgi:hypothetical protein